MMEMYELLEKLGLQKFFPEKLNRAILFSANNYQTQETKFFLNKKGYVRNYINGIIHYDGNCRFYSESEQKTSKPYKERRRESARRESTNCQDVHPLDISTSIFLCCDNVARQDLILHSFGCKHAFPIVVKTEQLEPPKLYLWPLRGLFYTNDGFTKPALSYVMKTISVLQFSRQDTSKSNLINMVISKSSEKVHSVFFHRDCSGSSKIKSEICTGMIEAMPVFDTELGSCLFLNLRGNCTHHSDQTRFMVMSSDVVIILCKTDEMNQLHDFVTKELIKSCKMLVIIFTDLDANDENIAFHSKVEDFSETLAIIVKNVIIAFKNLAHPEFIEFILCILKETKATCNEDKLVACARLNDFGVDLDSISETLEEAKSFADKTVSFNSKEKLFPLQGKVTEQWSKIDCEIFELKNWSSIKSVLKENVQKYREELEVKKQTLRLKQLQMVLDGHIQLTEEFVKKMNSIVELDVFLQAIKIHFDSATRLKLQPLHKKYVSLIYQHKVEKSNPSYIEEQLEKVEETVYNSSLTLTEFTREMGQLYEALILLKDTEGIPEHLMSGKLAEIAVSLLMKGNQIELMDSRTNDIPINWIQGVLLCLHDKLKDVRIKVITVLGVQSSGKSTLLNVMFGSQFEVSSGRCTRGINIHLVKVSPEVANEYQVDYLIILDTEGLFATSLKWTKDDRDQEERELATFVIGLSHVTILNVIGENISYLRDILPLSVHAFLRMDLVGLNSKCVLLRHSVDKAKKDQLLHQTYNLENALDKFTADACDIERVGRRRFKNIIQFDITTDDYFFPPLYESMNDLEIISPAYSNAAIQLKQKLLEDRNATGTLLELHSHLSKLWSSIKRDKFVYEFKSVIEIEAHATMDQWVWRLQWHIRRELQDNLTLFKNQVANCDNFKGLSQIEADFQNQTRSMNREQQEKNHKILLDEVPNKLLSKAINKLRNPSFRKLKTTIEECTSTCKAQFERDISYRRAEVKVLENDDRMIEEVDEFLKEHLSNEEGLGADDVKKNIDMLFRTWCNSLWANRQHAQHFEYEEDAINCMYSTFFAHRARVDAILHKKAISERNIEGFLEDLPRNWNHFADYRCNGHIEMALEIAKDCLKYMKRLVHQVTTMKVFYHTDIFTDIALEVRNHRFLYQRDVSMKPNFEIELSISLCGEFIKSLHAFEIDHTILSERLMQNAEKFFKRTCRKRLEYFTNITEASAEITGILTKELSHTILKGLNKELVIYLKQKYPFIVSKQTLLCHVLLRLVDQRELLNIYIHSPIKALEVFIKNIFDEVFLQKRETVFQLITECVDKDLKSISERLFQTKVKLNEEGSSETHSLKTCVEIICQSLDSVLTLNNIKVLSNDRIQNTKAEEIIPRIIDCLNDPDLRLRLSNEIHESFTKDHYEVIRHETVREILEISLGCKSTCPLCGELCCIGQDGHEGEHKALMHKPFGFQVLPADLANIASNTCLEKLELQRHEKSASEWFIQSDVTIDNNSYWKFMFASFSNEIASAIGQENMHIPSSWKALMKKEEIKKLEILIKRISE